MSRFEPRLDVLPTAQRRLWSELSEVPDHFVLYGDGDLATLPPALKHQLQDAAKDVDLDALPRLEAR